MVGAPTSVCHGSIHTLQTQFRVGYSSHAPYNLGPGEGNKMVEVGVVKSELVHFNSLAYALDIKPLL